MNRMKAFLSLRNHEMLSRQWRGLSASEYQIAIQFIIRNENLDKGSFDQLVNRMFLDMPDKPKHYKEIMELLSCANSTEHIPK